MSFQRIAICAMALASYRRKLSKVMADWLDLRRLICVLDVKPFWMEA
jgi:hypothetical protein